MAVASLRSTSCRTLLGKALIALPLCVIVLAVQHAIFRRAPQSFDFGSAFYVAAQMLRHGYGHQLFDIATQRKFQIEYLHALHGAFYSPPLVAVLYWPTAMFGVAGGHLLWSAINLVILATCAIILHQLFKIGQGGLTVFVLMFLFLPVQIQFLQGQVDVLLLLVVVLVLAAMERGKDVLAGLVLSLGLIKFQLILPLAVVFLLRGRWRVLTGLAMGSGLFVAACAWVSGMTAVLEYPRVLMQLTSRSDVGVNPWMMPNLRGLYFLFARHEAPQLLLLGISLLLLMIAAHGWKSLEQGFALAITLGLLTSYHLNPHSLILLLVPLAVVARRFSLPSWKSYGLLLLVCSGMMLPPLIMHRFALIAGLTGVLAWMLYANSAKASYNPTRDLAL